MNVTLLLLIFYKPYIFQGLSISLSSNAPPWVLLERCFISCTAAYINRAAGSGLSGWWLLCVCVSGTGAVTAGIICSTLRPERWCIMWRLWPWCITDSSTRSAFTSVMTTISWASLCIRSKITWPPDRWELYETTSCPPIRFQTRSDPKQISIKYAWQLDLTWQYAQHYFRSYCISQLVIVLWSVYFLCEAW